MSRGSGALAPQKDSICDGEAKASLPKNKKHTNLPHIDIKGYYQFITFRTYDSIDSYLKKLQNIDIPNKQKQQKIDNYLDSSLNGAYLNGEVLEYLYNFFKGQDKILYDLVAFSIMPNHIHLLFKPLDKLSFVMQKIKGVTAHNINKILNRKGKFWANNYYDKAIRDEKHFYIVYNYIKNNPLKIENEALTQSKEPFNSGPKAPLPKDKNSIFYKRFYGVYE